MKKKQQKIQIILILIGLILIFVTYFYYPYMNKIKYAQKESVEKNNSDIALIPIENSIAGRVAEIHNLIQKTSLKIIGEYFMKIELHLLGLKKTSFSKIKSVHSHIHALSQCRKIIKKI